MMWFVIGVIFATTTTVSALGITCYRKGPDDRENSTCIARPGGYCFSVVEEVWNPQTKENTLEWSFGCLPSEEQGLMRCKGYLPPLFNRKNILCCNHGNFCNREVFPVFQPGVPKDIRLNSIAVFAGIAASLTISIIFVIVASIVVYRARRRKRGLGGLGSFQGNLTNHGNDSSGSGSGRPLLVQRTIARQLSWTKCVGRGRYGEIWLATWLGEKVAVKVFFTLEEASWFRETEIYQTVLMRHDNILGFIAADIKGTGSWTQMLLITDYHENGSLHDYLQTNVLNRSEILDICYSIVSGIAHLHMEIFGMRGKPAIAHRDIKSRNILVKKNGECVIADFGLAVRFSSKNGRIDIAPNTRVGTKRYMAPEILEERINANSFDSFKISDMYSTSLVFWEVCRRCSTDKNLSVVERYAVPYQDIVPADPSFEDMRLAICVKKLRPEIPRRWERDSILFTLSRIMAECWHGNPAVRLTALRVKKTIGNLRAGIASVEDVA